MLQRTKIISEGTISKMLAEIGIKSGSTLATQVLRRQDGEFAKNTAITILSRILTFITGIALSIVIARALGPQGKGIYSLAILFPSLIVTFTNLGIGSATIYYIGQRKYSLKEVLGSNLILGFFISAICIAFATVAVFFFQNLFLKGVSRIYLLISLALIPAAVLYEYLSSILLGLQRIKEYNLTGIFKSLIFLILAIVILVGLKAGTMGAIFSTIITFFATSLFTFWRVRRIIRESSYKPSKAYARDALLYGIKSHLDSVLTFLNYRLDMFLVNLFINPLAVGYYSISVAIAEKIWMVSQAASIVLFPKVSSMTDEKLRKEFTPIVSRNVLLITGVGAIIVFFLSKKLILLLYSNAYQSSIRPLQILLLGIVALSAQRIIAHDFSGRGKPILNAYLSAISLIVNICLNFVWIPKIGIEGAAWASTVSYTVSLIVGLLMYKRISGNSIRRVLIVQRSDLIAYKRFLNTLVKGKRPQQYDQ